MFETSSLRENFSKSNPWAVSSREVARRYKLGYVQWMKLTPYVILQLQCGAFWYVNVSFLDIITLIISSGFEFRIQLELLPQWLLYSMEFVTSDRTKWHWTVILKWTYLIFKIIFVCATMLNIRNSAFCLHIVLLCVLDDFENKQRLFPYTASTDSVCWCTFEYIYI